MKTKIKTRKVRTIRTLTGLQNYGRQIIARLGNINTERFGMVGHTITMIMSRARANQKPDYYTWYGRALQTVEGIALSTKVFTNGTVASLTDQINDASVQYFSATTITGGLFTKVPKTTPEDTTQNFSWLANNFRGANGEEIEVIGENAEQNIH